VVSYKLQIKPSAAKELETPPKEDRQRIVAKIQRLTIAPRPLYCEKLSGHQLYRIRQGNYRILYTINDEDSLVVVVKVGHRREVYR
jgi:mRNA interferase RelE/StbE